VAFEDLDAQEVDEMLNKLKEELREHRYKPQALCRVEIPKDGKGKRPISIPTIRDRVVHTAAKLVLEPIFEADFDESAFGYRPKRSALGAVKAVHGALLDGKTEVIDADLSTYFDTIPHAELMKCLMRRISDGHMLTLLKMWLKVPVEARNKKGKPNRWVSGGENSTKGVPQGGPLSPLLANIYMHRYIKAFRKYGVAQKYGATLVNYADDFVVLCRHGAQDVLDKTRRWLTCMGLTLNEKKTSIRDAHRESFDFLGYTFKTMYSPRNGHRYIGARASKKSIHKMKRNVSGLLRPRNKDPWEKIVSKLNEKIVGWAQYFRYGVTSKVFSNADMYIRDSVRRFLRRREKRHSRGWKRYPNSVIHGELGVKSVRTVQRLAFANASV
jgi:RNA-directed DNA polymerase